MYVQYCMLCDQTLPAQPRQPALELLDPFFQLSLLTLQGSKPQVGRRIAALIASQRYVSRGQRGLPISGCE